ncbi:MAG TPA: dihydroorotase [Caulobacterales bacterium]|nr:dihydroorotase [Caulobacterales bacterium]
MSGKRILIRNARLIDPASNRDEIGGVLIEGDKILDVGAGVKEAAGAEIIDAKGLALLPGLIDMRVVTGEPGAEHKETFKSAGRAAAAGGVTTMVVMPDTDPVIDDVSLVGFVLNRAPGQTSVRVLPSAAITRGLRGEEMTEIGLLKDAGAVLFCNGARPIVDSRVLKRALAYATAFGALIAHRPEDQYLAAGGAMNEGALAMRLGLPGIPAAAETIMVERDLTLAAITGGRLMLDMLSCAASLAPLTRAKDAGVKALASVNVHHLTLTEDEAGDYRTFAKLSPPLRREEDRAALAQAVAAGLIDVIVSGHDPRPAEDKRLPFDEAAPGAAALETLLPAALSLHYTHGLSLISVLRALTVRPAEILGLPQGRLAKGAPADVILVNLDATYEFDADNLRSKSRNSPFDEKQMRGRVVRTIVAGESVFEG